jgi:hypothetical protein
LHVSAADSRRQCTATATTSATATGAAFGRSVTSDREDRADVVKHADRFLVEAVKDRACRVAEQRLQYRTRRVQTLRLFDPDALRQRRG